MAWVGKIPSGKYQAQVRLPDGRRVTKTHRLKGVVDAWARQLEADIAAGRWDDPAASKMTYAQWREVFMAARRVEPETLRGDQAVMRTHIAPTFDKVPLAGIRPTTIKSWLTGMAKAEVGQATQVRAFNLLRSSLAAAVDDEILAVNPCEKVDAPKPGKPPVQWFTREQVDAIVDQLGDRDAAMVAVMAWCGLRWGECAGLRVSDVDWLRRQLHVHQVVTQAGRIKAYPKSAASRRTLPVPDHVLALLSPLAAGKKPSGLLFATSSGGPLSAPNWRKAYYGAVERAGVPEYPPHALRHTAASWLVQAGVSLVEVQRLLGHSTPTMTNRYAHLAPGAHSAVERAWEALNPPATAGTFRRGT